MVMEDPDSFELADYLGIGIFEPGTEFERDVQLIKVFLYVGFGFALMGLVSVGLAVGLLFAGMIDINPYTLEIVFEPWAFLIISAAEVGLFIPPLLYVKQRKISLRSIGLRKRISVPKEMVLGLGVGVLMLGANYVITWIVTWGADLSDQEVINPFASASFVELGAWVVVMFSIVGFSEELIFRGFLQKRMEFALKGKTKQHSLSALVITSIIFSALHFDAFGFAARFVLGLFLGYLAQVRNYSIVGPSVAHGFNNSVVVILAFFGIF